MIITGVEAMREALVTKAVDFAGRPDGVLLSHLTQGKGTTPAVHRMTCGNSYNLYIIYIIYTKQVELNMRNHGVNLKNYRGF